MHTDFRPWAFRLIKPLRCFRKLFLILAFAIPSPLLLAAETEAVKTEQTPEQLHQVGWIRVFYRSEGIHAVDPVDVNQNGVPDQVEDVAIQAKAACLLFVDTLGFPDPFKTERYRGAEFLDITLRSKNVLGTNGKAYDELQRFNRPGDPKNTLSLSFSVATSVHPPSNLTPAHEFFHVLQNSVSRFKNRWYAEGTARWSERGLGVGALGPVKYDGTLPLSDEKQATVFGMAYEASEYFWNALALKDDPEGVIPESQINAELKELTYVDGSKVLKDFRFTGWKLMREVLRELDKVDDIAFREQGYDRWSEENQRSERNNPYILQAVMNAGRTRKETNANQKNRCETAVAKTIR